MTRWFSIEGWEHIAFVAQILAWLLGATALILAIIIYFAKSNVSLLREEQNGPRAVTVEQNTVVKEQLKKAPLSVLVVKLADLEAAQYAEQIIATLASGGATIRIAEIGQMMPVPYGLLISKDGADPSGLLAALRAAGLKAEMTDTPAPIPLSIKGQFAGFVTLIVGRKPPQ